MEKTRTNYGSEFTKESIVLLEHNLKLAKPSDVEGVECEDVTLQDITQDHIDVTKRMFRFLAQEGGVGLAAPQVSILKKFFVYWGRDNTPMVCYNPKYYGAGKLIKQVEECLTYPSSRFQVSRFKYIQAIWYIYDADKKDLIKQTARLSGLEAQIFQHETDHLEGETISR